MFVVYVLRRIRCLININVVDTSGRRSNSDARTSQFVKNSRCRGVAPRSSRTFAVRFLLTSRTAVHVAALFCCFGAQQNRTGFTKGANGSARSHASIRAATPDDRARGVAKASARGVMPSQVRRALTSTSARPNNNAAERKEPVLHAACKGVFQ